MKILCHPLTSDRWQEFERLFGARGAYGGCWCMWWRLTRREFEAGQGEGNRMAMRAIVESGRIPGILAYTDSRVVAWCSVAPREEFGALNRSRILKAIDDKPVWSIVCFYVAKGYRHRGLIADLIRGAIAYVKKEGGVIVEAYPSVPRSKEVPPTSSYMGFPDMFSKAGFVECARPSKAKRIMRYTIG
jgi:GNAT superfamily N-acetyltransferase